LVLLFSPLVKTLNTGLLIGLLIIFCFLKNLIAFQGNSESLDLKVVDVTQAQD
jgi:hypothetical protein